KQFAVTRDAKHLHAAARAYRRYLAQAPEGARRKDAAEALEQLEPMLATLGSPSNEPASKSATIVQITSLTPGVTVVLGDAAPAPPPVTREVTPGVHRVQLTAPGHVPEARTIEAVEGQFSPFSFDLKELPAAIVV